MSTPKHFYVSIPTQAYIARFLTSIYGSVISVRENSLLGKEFLHMIRMPLGSQLSSEKIELLSDLYNDQIKLSVPLKLKNSVVHDLSQEHIVTINQYLKRYFDTQLNQFCTQYVNPERKNKVGYKHAIEVFARIHGIILEEDITYECLKKSDYRFRQKNQDQVYRFKEKTPARNNKSGIPSFPSAQISCFN